MINIGNTKFCVFTKIDRLGLVSLKQLLVTLGINESIAKLEIEDCQLLISLGGRIVGNLGGLGCQDVTDFMKLVGMYVYGFLVDSLQCDLK